MILVCRIPLEGCSRDADITETNSAMRHAFLFHETRYFRTALTFLLPTGISLKLSPTEISSPQLSLATRLFMLIIL